jgi:hypothetical protein
VCLSDPPDDLVSQVRARKIDAKWPELVIGGGAWRIRPCVPTGLLLQRSCCKSSARQLMSSPMLVMLWDAPDPLDIAFLFSSRDYYPYSV